MAASSAKYKIILTYVLTICILSAYVTAPPPPPLPEWDVDTSSVDSKLDEDAKAVWDDSNSFDLDDDSSLNRSPELSHKRWFEDDLTSHLEDIDDDLTSHLEDIDDSEDNQIDDGDEAVDDEDNDGGDQEEELVIEGIDEDDPILDEKIETTKDLVDDTLKLRHGGRTRHDEDDSSDEDEFPEEDMVNFQELDKLPETNQNDLLLGAYNNILSYPDKDDDFNGSDENGFDDVEDDDTDGDDESDDDFDDDDFAGEDDKKPRIFEDRVVMF